MQNIWVTTTSGVLLPHLGREMFRSLASRHQNIEQESSPETRTIPSYCLPRTHVFALGCCGDELAFPLRLALGPGLINGSNVQRACVTGHEDSDWRCTTQATWKGPPAQTVRQNSRPRTKFLRGYPCPGPPLFSPSAEMRSEFETCM